MNTEFTRKDQQLLSEAYTGIYEEAPAGGEGDAISANIQSGISTELANYFKQFGQKLAAANVKVDPGVINNAMVAINKAVKDSMLKNKKPATPTTPTTPGTPSATPEGTPQQSI